MEVATKADIERVVELVQQFGERFDHVDRRLESIENRLDRVNDTLANIQNQMAAMTRWADRFDREASQTIATQAAQQRAIDALAARVAKLEERKAS